MKITFRSVELKNFMSFEKAVVSFQNKGYTSIVGTNQYKIDNSMSNGSGKSTIFEAMSWCLTGDTIRGSKEVCRFDCNDECYVSLDLLVDKDNYKITRYKSPSKLFVIKNDVNISGKGIKDTEKILAESIPDLTSQLLGSVIILGQGLPQKFSSNTPSGRKEILEKLSKSDFMIEDIKSRIIKRKSQLSTDVRSLEDKSLSLQTSINNYTTSLESTRVSINQLPDISDCKISIKLKNEELESVVKEISETETSLISLQGMITEKSDLKPTLEKEYDDKLDKLKDDNDSKIDTEYKNKANLELKIRLLESEILKIKNIKDVCPTCGQKLPNVVKPPVEDKEEELAKLRTEYAEVNTSYLELVNEYNQQVDKIKKDKFDSTSSLNKEIQELNSNYTVSSNYKRQLEGHVKTLEKQILELTSVISEHDSKLKLYKELESSYEEKIESSKSELLYINSELDNLRKHQEVISKFETVVKRDFRGYLLSNIIEYINRQSKIYCKDIFDTDKIEFKLDGNNISISYNEKEYECLSGGEKQKIDLIVQFSIRDMLCKYLNFSSNILVLDEITDNLDTLGCQRVFDLISNRLKDVESIYIISHHTDLMFPVDYELIITKGIDGISRIV